MNPVDKRMKGVIFKGYANFIKKKGGIEALRMCSQDIGFDFINIVDEKWYPDVFSYAAIQWVQKTYGKDALRQMGYAAVSERGVISVAARVMGIKKVLESAQKELNDTINFGRVDCYFNEHGATMVLTDLVVDPIECEVWLGVFEGLMHISGAKGSVEKKSCQREGAQSCRYELVWK